MAQKFILPVLDDTSACTSYYQVLYKLTTEDWTAARQLTYTSPLPTQTLGSPATNTPVIIIKPLPDGQNYNVQVRRFCCDGTYSDYATTSFKTGSTK